MKISVLTLGCKANQSESFIIEATLRARGCEIVALEEGPDYCIVNTCSVTSKSDYQSRQLIRRASRIGSNVIVTGCYSELNKAFVESMVGVVKIVDIDKKNLIVNMLSSETSSSALCLDSPFKSRFFLKVQDGCDHSCSYCIIPKARGKSRSVPLEKVIEQVVEATHAYNEIVLTGIHLGTYGYDLCPKVRLADLLSAILVRTPVRRVRLSSLEIGEIDDKLLDLIRNDRVCSHLHIPLQSGDDRILGIMNRNYTAGEFQEGVIRITERIPGIAIGSDIIAGFPGEGEPEFNNTLSLLRSLPLSYLHVFPFSPRPGTRAFEMRCSIDSATTRMRCTSLRALGMQKKTAYMKAHIGKTLDLLVEERDSEGIVVGTTGNYLKVRASVPGAHPKDIVSVRIAGVRDNVLTGHPIHRV